MSVSFRLCSDFLSFFSCYFLSGLCHYFVFHDLDATLFSTVFAFRCCCCPFFLADLGGWGGRFSKHANQSTTVLLMLNRGKVRCESDESSPKCFPECFIFSLNMSSDQQCTRLKSSGGKDSDGNDGKPAPAKKDHGEWRAGSRMV